MPILILTRIFRDSLIFQRIKKILLPKQKQRKNYPVHLRNDPKKHMEDDTYLARLLN